VQLVEVTAMVELERVKSDAKVAYLPLIIIARPALDKRPVKRGDSSRHLVTERPCLEPPPGDRTPLSRAATW